MRHTLSATWNSMKMKPLLQLLLGVASSLSLCLSGITPLPIFQQVPALVLTEGLMYRTMMAMKNRRNHYINSAVEPPRRSPVVPRKELMCKIHRRDRGLKTLGHRRGLRLIRDWMAQRFQTPVPSVDLAHQLFSGYDGGSSWRFYRAVDVMIPPVLHRHHRPAHQALG